MEVKQWRSSKRTAPPLLGARQLLWPFYHCKRIDVISVPLGLDGNVPSYALSMCCQTPFMDVVHLELKEGDAPTDDSSHLVPDGSSCTGAM